MTYPIPVAGGYVFACLAGHIHYTEETAEKCEAKK